MPPSRARRYIGQSVMSTLPVSPCRRWDDHAARHAEAGSSCRRRFGPSRPTISPLSTRNRLVDHAPRPVDFTSPFGFKHPLPRQQRCHAERGNQVVYRTSPMRLKFGKLGQGNTVEIGSRVPGMGPVDQHSLAESAVWRGTQYRSCPRAAGPCS